MFITLSQLQVKEGVVFFCTFASAKSVYGKLDIQRPCVLIIRSNTK